MKRRAGFVGYILGRVVYPGRRSGSRNRDRIVTVMKASVRPRFPNETPLVSLVPGTLCTDDTVGTVEPGE